MSKLTEKEVLKNARVVSLEHVKTLNCWARKLKDVRFFFFFFLKLAYSAVSAIILFHAGKHIKSTHKP